MRAPVTDKSAYPDLGIYHSHSPVRSEQSSWAITFSAELIASAARAASRATASTQARMRASTPLIRHQTIHSSLPHPDGVRHNVSGGYTLWF
jgi:hypothetical protein